MKPKSGNVLTINGGSSSIRFAVYEAGAKPKLLAAGKVDRIGLSGTNLVVDDPSFPKRTPLSIPDKGRPAAVDFLCTGFHSSSFRQSGP